MSFHHLNFHGAMEAGTDFLFIMKWELKQLLGKRDIRKL